MRDWAKDEVDAKFLADSGLLFELNRTVLHLVGVALTVKLDAKGNHTLSFKDGRAAPHEVKFDAATIEMGRMKLEKFMAEFGHRQMDRRTAKMGSATQFVPQPTTKTK